MEKGYWQELVHRLCHIGVELSAQQDVDGLLEFILKESMAITGCDAGSIYIIVDQEPRQLEFKYTFNNSVEFPFKRFFMPLNTNSIAGASAVTGSIYNFSDMIETISTLGFKHNVSYDEQAGYHTKNMLVIPLKNYEQEVIGVLQLINKKTDPRLLHQEADYASIISFTKDDEEIISALASQAAILVERSQLFEAIQDTLESTVGTLATALDQRDPITAGHSNRVAGYAHKLAQYVTTYHRHLCSDYQFSKERLRELQIAGLLHDVGKIGVPEYLLMKDKKLNEAQFDALVSRFKYIALMLSVKSQQEDLGENEIDFLRNWQKDLQLLTKINGSGFLDDEGQSRVKALSELVITDTLTQEDLCVLNAHEIEQLTIKRGNLTDQERLKINSHASKTYELLKDIKWTRALVGVPEIAAQHHEKLNGQGYPLGLKAEALNTAARMMAIADIYDALTAKDRPYKPAMSIEKSLSILDEEAARGALDPTLVSIFRTMIESKWEMGHD